MAIGTCSFCKKNNVETLKTTFKSNIIDICGDCIEQALSLIDVDLIENKGEEDKPIEIKTPKEIKNILDSYVVGQDRVKKILSVGVYNHYKMINNNSKNDDITIEKSNILLIGDTGSGKTYLAKILAKILNVPFCIADATSLTEAGYVGEDVENILTRLLQVSKYRPKLAEKGIVYIDEIDKISRKSENVSLTRDVSGEGVQQALLKLLEGTIIDVPKDMSRRNAEQKFIKVDTSNILFICGGAFEGLNKFIETRMKCNSLGFGSIGKQDENKNSKNILEDIVIEDLRKFGLIPELLGRLPIVGILDKIDRETLLKILKEPKNSIINQYKALLRIDNKELSITDEALNLIVDSALKLKTGARGLRSICEKIFTDVMYESPSKPDNEQIIVDADFVKNFIKTTND